MSGWSRNTLKTRNSQWKRFFNFCSDHNLTPLPASDRTVVRFLMFQSESSTFNTVNNYLSAICALHKFYGYQTDFRDSYMIKMFLSGIARILGKKVKQKLPISIEHLFLIYKKLDLSDPNTITMWCAMVLCFRSLLRKSNVVPEEESFLGHTLRRKDAEFSRRGVVLSIKSTKTIQHLDRELLIPLNFLDSSVLCVASMLRVHFMMCPRPLDSPLFWIKCDEPNKWRMMLYKDLLKFIKYCISLIGLSDSDFGTHSLRRGGVQFLQSVGVPFQDLQFMGDWRSFAIMHYLVTPLERRFSIEDDISDRLDRLAL